LEKEEFIAVVKEYQKLIYKICYSYCKDPDNRKDLEQEILIQLWKSFEKFDGRVKISTWIYRIALNTAISFYRSDTRISRHRAPIPESVLSLPDTGDEPELEENISALYRFIDGLERFDKALILLYLDSRKYSEISTILGITETNVATKISRIKESIKQQFKRTNGYGIR
jgi:RNA polymerase sigma factor (sigma-70 family)